MISIDTCSMSDVGQIDKAIADLQQRRTALRAQEQRAFAQAQFDITLRKTGRNLNVAVAAFETLQKGLNPEERAATSERPWRPKFYPVDPLLSACEIPVGDPFSMLDYLGIVLGRPLRLT